MPRYLAGSSIWAWANKDERPDIRIKLAERYERGEVLSCAPVILETMDRARTGAEYEDLYRGIFEPLDRLQLTNEVADRAVEVQRQMAKESAGNHRRPPHDFLISAIAEAADAVLWAFDKDLRVIAEHTGQRYEAEDSARGDG